jgi:hypothetical protein
MYLLHDSWVLSKFLEYERLDRKAEVDLFCKFFGLELDRLLENDSGPDIFDGACGPDIFHTAKEKVGYKTAIAARSTGINIVPSATLFLFHCHPQTLTTQKLCYEYLRCDPAKLADGTEHCTFAAIRVVLLCKARSPALISPPRRAAPVDVVWGAPLAADREDGGNGAKLPCWVGFVLRLRRNGNWR